MKFVRENTNENDDEGAIVELDGHPETVIHSVNVLGLTNCVESPPVTVIVSVG